MTITVASEFVDALRDFHLLDQTQLDKVNRALQGRTTDPRVLAKELVKQGWLTPFQVNLLIQGRGSELLLGPYVLQERLGEGGMGQVYKARHPLMDRTVAIKVIRKELLAQRDAVERFRQEIRLAAQLDHPHLVRAHDAAQVGDTHFLVMEYAEGTDLQALVQKSGPLSAAQACSYIRQAALGLQHAGERGLVHRDIKPSNLQLTAQGTVVKIMDMGLARSQAPDGSPGRGAGLTQARTLMGTPDYMAPEQIDDPRRVDIRADIYSLGCTLYFLLAGRPPFPDGTWDEKLACHRRVEPAAIDQLRPDIHPAISTVLRRMMAKRPQDRYATPVGVADALAPFCGAAGQGAAGGLKGPWPSAVPVPLNPGQAVGGPASPTTPTAAYEAGWTLKTQGTIHPTAAPATPLPASPLAQPTLLVPGPPTGQPGVPYSTPPAPGSLKRLVLVLAGVGAVVGLLVLVVILIWPKSGNKEKSGDQDKDGGDKSRVFIDEDFRSTAGKRALPEGWEGDAFRVIKVDDEPCLEVSKMITDRNEAFQVPKKPRFVTLPPVKLNGDFYIGGAYFMQGSSYGLKGVQHLTIRLENRKSNSLLVVVIDQTGSVLIGDDLTAAPPNYKAGTPTKFLVTRKGKQLSVWLNDEIVVDKALGEAAEYESFKLGMTAGGADGLMKGYLGSSRLYRLKAGTMKAGGSVPPSNMELPKGPAEGPRRKHKQ